MIKLKRLAAAALTLTLTLSMGTTALATEATNSDTENLTQEEKDELYKKQLEEIYNKPVQSNDIEGWPAGPGTYGEAAIVMDAGTGAILYAKNIDDKHYPASITKVLTALVAFENSEMDDEVTISADCVDFLQPGDSSIALKKGNKLSMEDILYATLLASANEAAYAVAENAGKNAGYDYDWFIEQMNEKCDELGCVNSNWVNANGLHDENHYTCARDMALIGKELFKYPEFFDIVQTRQYIIEESDTVEEHVFQQKHKMLLDGYQAYYPYAIGGKTGYTSDALNTLITMADNGEQQLVCVVLREQGGKSYPDTTALFEYVFNNFKRISVADLEQSEDVGEVLTNQDGGYVTLPEGVEFADLKMQLTPDETPTGEATLTYTYEGNVVGTARATLSDSYIDEHKTKIEVVDDEKEKTGSSKDNKILLGAGIIFVVLVIAFIRVSIMRRRKCRRRRSGRRR